jgi:peptide/nickel transport system permease protein
VGLRGYLLKRGINSIILIFFVVTLNFAIFELMPGLNGAIENLVSNPRSAVTPENQALILRQYKFCQDIINGVCKPFPIWDRYGAYLQNMLTFNFGYSSKSGALITDELFKTGRLANTLELIGTATAIALVLGIFLGVLAAAKRGTVYDSTAVIASLTTGSLPTFFMGILFIIIFAEGLKWFPTGGVTPADWIRGLPPLPTQILVRLQHLFLPVLTLTLFIYGGNLLLARATTLETLNDDYVLTARAKGLKNRTVLFKHVLKNASLPLITIAALSFGFILTGAIITETIFNWDGLGLWLYTAVTWKDYPVMQAMFFIIALSVIAANLVADILYGWIDPRIRYQ